MLSELTVTGSGLFLATGLAIDVNRDLLFWSDSFHDRIEMIYINGTGRKVSELIEI